MTTRRRIHFHVRGQVQGVCYRASARRTACAEQLAGWVRNREDGGVEGEAEGAHDAIERFLAWCRIGPPAARVDEVIVAEARADERVQGGFEIRA